MLDQDNPPSLAILDWMMPGLTGPDVCRLVRQKANEHYTYLILLTSKNLKEDVVAGMDSGADDYVTKPFDHHELKVRLRAGTRIIDLQEQLLRTREELRYQATRDYLTKLWNRSAIMGLLDRELSRSHREGTSVGIVVVDIDHFKSINDTYGHHIGDLALQTVANRMSQGIRAYDAIGRYGGEEFLIVLPGCDRESTVRQCNRLREALCNEPLEIPGSKLQLSASFGCTALVSQGLSDSQSLINVADKALYEAKARGRNRVFYWPHAADVQLRQDEKRVPAFQFP